MVGSTPTHKTAPFLFRSRYTRAHSINKKQVKQKTGH